MNHTLSPGQPRDHLFDNIKALMLFLVPLGHTLDVFIADGNVEEILMKYIYLFHMPIFAFVTGYFTKNLDKARENAVKKCLIPYLVFQGLYILMAVAAGAIVLVILRLMQRIVHVNTLKRLEVQFIHRAQTLAFLNEYFMNLGVKVLDMDFHAESRPEGNLYTNLYTLSMPAKMSYVDVIGTLSEHPNIRTVRTRNL